MANKAISELPQALNVNNQDLFVLEQSGIAKKLTAETFITEQGIIDALAEALDGHGGISSVTLSSVSGRIRTYLITFTDETTTTFQVLDGTSIDRIVKTSTAGAVDTYTIYMSDGTTSFFNVTNGSNIASITKTSSSGLVDTYTITLSDGSTTTFDVTNGTAAIDTTLTISGRAADAKATGDALKMSKTTSGEIVLVTDAEADTPRGLTVEIPYQSGGLSSFTMRFRRRNMLDQTGTLTSAGITYTPQADGTMKLSGTATGNSRYGWWGNTAYLNANNIYNLPAGKYSFYVHSETLSNYVSAGLHVYKGSTTTKIADTVAGSVNTFTNSATQLGRVSCQLSSGNAYGSGTIYRYFLGVGDGLTIDDWDAPATTHDELSVSIGETIYGGTVDLVNGVVTSRYASDGTLLVTPTEISISVVLPTLFNGANTIWTSVVGSTLSLTYACSIENYVDSKENTSNKTTALTSSSTNTQYPSAKATYDFITGNTINWQAYALDNVLCIGDSLTAGSSYYSNGTWIGNIVQCYPYFLGRYLNCTCTNAGDGGETVLTWYNKHFAQYTYTDYNAVIIFLGTNDGLTDTLAEDVEAYESYTDYAATNTGRYCRMIEEIQAANANCQIILVNVFSTATGSNTTRSVISQIATKYSLPLVDTSDLLISTSPEYHGAANVHLSKMGYAYLAKLIVKTITEWIEADVTRGDFGRNVRDTDPDS